MTQSFDRAVAVQILKAINQDITSRDAITSYVREQLAPLNITAEQIEAAAHGIVDVWATIDRFPVAFEREAS